MATVKYNLGTVGGMAVTELWSGSVGNLASEGTGKITLNDDLTNYKFLIFDLYCTSAGDISTRRYYDSKVVSVQHLINEFNEAVADTNMVFCWGHSNDDIFAITKDSTTKVLNFKSRYTHCTRIVGIN